LFPYYVTLATLLPRTEQSGDLVSFAKAYGYVKYFRPSTEADQVDWGWFSVYGSEEVLKCQNKEELLQTMKRIFKPIAPTVSFTQRLNWLSSKIVLKTNRV